MGSFLTQVFSGFSFRKQLVAATFLSVTDDDGLLEIITHHCTLYARLEWPSLAVHQFTHRPTFIYKAILGLLPQQLCDYIFKNNSNYGLRSDDLHLLNVPKVCSELGKLCLKYSPPAALNSLQKTLNLKELVILGTFNKCMRDLEIISQERKTSSGRYKSRLGVT